MTGANHVAEQQSLRRSERVLRRKVTIESDENKSLFTEMRPLDEWPILKVGVIADIQYAPVEDGHSFSGVPRYYRHALETARIAAEHFEKEKVQLLVNLGDIIDGKCNNEPGGGEAAIDDVLGALSVYRHGPLISTYGNHELYSLSREDIGEKLNIPFVAEPHGDLVGYHSYVPVPGIRFIVLDTYDIAMMGRCPINSPKRKEAERLLTMYNHNFPHVENSPDGLDGLRKRFVAFNGGIGPQQLSWLQETLHLARSNYEKVIVLSHQPILPGSSSPVCLVWNYNDLLPVLRQYSDIVIASFSGHAHKGGYKRDENSGIHFRVIEAVLESPHPINTYAFIDVYWNKLVLRGHGQCASAVYDFDHLSSPHHVQDPTPS